jgi:hypothetical protein
VEFLASDSSYPQDPRNSQLIHIAQNGLDGIVARESQPVGSIAPEARP